MKCIKCGEISTYAVGIHIIYLCDEHFSEYKAIEDKLEKEKEEALKEYLEVK